MMLTRTTAASLTLRGLLLGANGGVGQTVEKSFARTGNSALNGLGIKAAAQDAEKSFHSPAPTRVMAVIFPRQA
jgi:hypothetical protein